MMNHLPFERLNGRVNFASWKIGAKAHLITKGLWKFCSTDMTEYSTEDFLAKDERALAELTLLVDSTVYTHLEDCKYAKDGWTALLLAFEDKVIVRKVTLLKQWISLKLVDCESMQSYVTQCLSLYSKIKSAGFKIDEQIAGAIMLCELSEEFKPMVMSIETKGDELTVDYVKNILLQEIDFDKNEHPVALAVKGKSSQKYSKKSKKTVKCFECDGPHYKKQCPKLKTMEKAVLYTSFVVQKSSPDDWNFDSGATAHMTNSDSLMRNISKPIINEVTVANKQKLIVEKTGDIV